MATSSKCIRCKTGKPTQGFLCDECRNKSAEKKREYQNEWQRNRTLEKKVSGLCGTCGKPAEDGFSNCRKCLDKLKLKTAECRASGTCTSCKKMPASGGLTVCESCREIKDASQRKVRKQRRDSGLCTDCGSPTEDGHAYCLECLASRRERSKEWKESGLCISCGRVKQDPSHVVCESCRAHQRARHAELKAAGICTKCCQAEVEDARAMCRGCREKIQSSRADARLLVIRAYGGACACCGTTIEGFLQLHHTRDDGKKHRDEVGAGSMYRWARDNGFPADVFTTLCASCHMWLTWYSHLGPCPCGGKFKKDKEVQTDDHSSSA